MMRNKDDYRSMSGVQKAALLVMSVGEETAAKLFAQMHDDEIREISQTMANLGTVNATVIERLFVEFADAISSTGTMTGTFESTERLLSKVLDKNKVDQIMEEIRGPAGRTMWDKLGNVHEAVLANFLKNEYP
ncbi:MAG: flagellar motor switch protein FliG, partial [Rhodospirillaceae bacterium]|nr:flagellar motor switch protein FliG [Rhodospirillaceae bacterium]